MKRHAKPAPIDEKTGKVTENKKDKKKSFKTEDVEEYIDSLHAKQPYVEDFTFERRPDESRDRFMKRVEIETHVAVSKSKLQDKFEVKYLLLLLTEILNYTSTTPSSNGPIRAQRIWVNLVPGPRPSSSSFSSAYSVRRLQGTPFDLGT